MSGRRPGFSHNPHVREKIRTSVLIDRLMKNAEADQEFMSANQIRCAEILLKKTLPDLTFNQNEHSGFEGGPLEIKLIAGRVNCDD